MRQNRNIVTSGEILQNSTKDLDQVGLDFYTIHVVAVVTDPWHIMRRGILREKEEGKFFNRDVRKAHTIYRNYQTLLREIFELQPNMKPHEKAPKLDPKVRAMLRKGSFTIKNNNERAGPTLSFPLNSTDNLQNEQYVKQTVSFVEAAFSRTRDIGRDFMQCRKPYDKVEFCLTSFGNTSPFDGYSWTE